MRLRSYFIIGAICAMLLVAWTIVGAEEQKFGSGLTHKGSPVVLAIPNGHPDFTLGGVMAFRRITEEVVLLKVGDHPSIKGTYILLACYHSSNALALHYSGPNGDSYWIYESNMLIVDSTKEDFEKLITEAQYLCPSGIEEI